MTKYQALADHLAAIAYHADTAATSVAALDHPEDFPDSLGEMKARAGRDTSVLLDLMDMPVEYAAMMAELDGRNEQAATPLPATEKTDHPALQPVLRRPEVTTLLAYIEAERAKAELRGRDYHKLGLRNEKERAYSYAAGLATAHELVTQMWQATVIATNAANTNLNKEEQPE